MLNISFGAKSLSKENIFKYNKNLNSYNQANVSFVEINPKNSNDYTAVSEAVKSWQNETYGTNIMHTVKELKKDYVKGENHKIYALTSQKDNLQKLNSDMILGLVQIELEENKTPYLSYLQTNPDYTEQYAFYFERIYKGVGTAILNALKKLYNSILLKASNRGLDYFYTKNDFHLVDKLGNKYLWKK